MFDFELSQKPIIINGRDYFYAVDEKELVEYIKQSVDSSRSFHFRFWDSKPTDEERQALAGPLYGD